MKRARVGCPSCGSRDVWREDDQLQCWECGYCWTDEDYVIPREEDDDDAENEE